MDISVTSSSDAPRYYRLPGAGCPLSRSRRVGRELVPSRIVVSDKKLTHRAVEPLGLVGQQTDFVVTDQILDRERLLIGTPPRVGPASQGACRLRFPSSPDRTTKLTHLLRRASSRLLAFSLAHSSCRIRRFPAVLMSPGSGLQPTEQGIEHCSRAAELRNRGLTYGFTPGQPCRRRLAGATQ